MPRTIELSPAVQQQLESVASKKQMSADELANEILSQILEVIDVRHDKLENDNRSVSDAFILEGTERFDELLRRLAQ